ncbi:hypothetical protein M422DRAFT_169513 [Sphaerobolus stellatus SS14]|uniref:Uncharacterized protein n=1 Tax=Sphaerobolus stellatus (strain SS14) TaxID=990650 RepID=A0A0C9UKV4_SPHS4|nr:hypothetical protein M422DRAFT_169513 [Sphaerobolus stellatus SS14]
MPQHPTLRHFHKGISKISQWTGHEYKEMERTFASLIWGAVPPDVSAVAHTVVDFVYYASLKSHSTETLWRLQDALDTFHKYKGMFVRLGVHNHFRIPKIHMMEHYVMLIHLKGSADWYNTEQSERLHIDCAKQGYRASNKKNYTDQMVRYLTRRESIHTFGAFLSWIKVVEEKLEDGEEIAEEDANELSSIPPLPSLPASDETMAIKARAGLTWHVATKAPFPNTSVPDLIKHYGATDIVPALTKYLNKNVPSSRVTPTEYDRFDVFKRITADIPSVHRLTEDTVRNVIRATPPLKKEAPGHFDCILVHHSLDAEDVGLKGYRAARIHVIFRLPPWHRCDHILAYIEWFTGFSKPVMPLRMLEASYASHAGRRVGVVIPVASIRRSCHLVPKFGKSTKKNSKDGPPWNSDTVMDQCTRFFFNSQLSLNMFQFCDGDYELVEESSVSA